MSKKKIDFPSRAARRDYLLKKELSEGGSVVIVTENTDSIEFSGDGSKESPLKAEAVGLGSAAEVDVVQGVGSSATNVMSQKAVTDVLNTKADKTVSISAGTGLSGGGDLTTNRTLSVNYGTTSTTAARGDDIRITGAAQKSANLSDLTDPATARSNLGLGTSAERDVGEGSGNVLGVGSFGIGGRGRDLSIDEDIREVSTGIYNMQDSHPQNEWGAIMTFIVSRSGEFGTYIACHTSENKIYYASGYESSSLDWGELVFLDDVQRIVDEAVDKALNQ